MFEAFVNLDTESNEVLLSGRNDTLGWSFRLIMGVTGLVTEAERLFDKLEDATPTIAKEIRERDFKKYVADSDRQQKRFKQFGEDEKQAFLGDPRGQFAIGRAFAAGGSFPMKDPFRAYFWLSLAAARGVNDAARYRDKVERDMTPEKVSEAQALAAAWKPMTPKEWEKHNEEIVDRLRIAEKNGLLRVVTTENSAE